LPPVMKDSAHNVRELGNDSAHPGPEQLPTSAKDRHHGRLIQRSASVQGCVNV